MSPTSTPLTTLINQMRRDCDASLVVSFSYRGDHCGDYPSKDLHRVLDACEEMREALERVCEPKRLNDMSRLSSSPPRNGAIWDLQIDARAVLAKHFGEGK